MPLPMVHLSIAVQVHALADRPLTPEFLLGSLAPDAIHMRANTNSEDKKRVHLHITEMSEPEALERVRFMIGQNHPGKNELDPFLEGYAAHLLSDYWWIKSIVQPFFEQLPPDTSPAERRTWYYRETDRLDINLYYRMHWRKTVGDLLTTVEAPEFPPYLTSDEINRWRHRTMDWFEMQNQEPDYIPQIITDQLEEGFIKVSAQRIQHLLFQCHE